MMPRTKLLSIGIVLMGAIALAGGGALVLLKLHHTIAYGVLAIGVVLAVAGVGLAFSTRTSAQSQRLSRPSEFGSTRRTSSRTLQTLIAALIIGGATVGSYVYVSSQLSAQSGSKLGLSLNVDSASEVAYSDGGVGVTLHVTAVGGLPPYTFVATWGDKTSQTSTTGNFTRVFGATVPLSTDVTITAKSANSGIGYLLLSLPSQAPVAGGAQSTRTLNIVPAYGAQTSQGGVSASTTQTKVTSAFIAVTSTFAATVSTTSSPSPAPFTGEVTVNVWTTSGQPVSGATVRFEGSTTQTTPISGGVVFSGVSPGLHDIVVTYGAWSITIRYNAGEGSPSSINVTAPGQ
jgi:hypothetical protein